MIIYSTGSNFGAPANIRFKTHQESNFAILNAVFKYRTDSPAYAAADVLEIYLPTLSIDRSTECGVFMRFLDRQRAYNYNSVNDAGTVLKSWIKDSHTLCIEKLTDFDTYGEITIYIYAFYAQLGRGSNTIKGTKTTLSPTTDPARQITFTEGLFMTFEKWVFLHLQVSSVSYYYEKSPFEITLPSFPNDVSAIIPLPGGSCQYNPSVDGMSEARINQGKLYITDRVGGFTSTAYYPFMFAYLVRGDNEDEPALEEPTASGTDRLRLQFEEAEGMYGNTARNVTIEDGRNYLHCAIEAQLEFVPTKYADYFTIDDDPPALMLNYGSYHWGRTVDQQGKHRIRLIHFSPYVDRTPYQVGFDVVDEASGNYDIFDTSAVG